MEESNCFSEVSLEFMNSNPSLTLLEALKKGTLFLQKHHVEEPRLNTEYLLAHQLGLQRLELYLQFNRLLEEEELNALRQLLLQRSRGIPLQYLLGTVEFLGRIFLSDQRALIPRPETEQLLEHVLAHHQCQRILDVGTGSGVIAISIALEKPVAEVEAIDCSLEALELAQENAKRYHMTNIQWHHGNLLSALEKKEILSYFDLIVANLPYLLSKEISTLSRELSYEPIIALDGGEDGLYLIKKLIRDAPKYLQSPGILLLEIGRDQEEKVVYEFKKNGYQNILTFPDHQGILRFVQAVYTKK